MNFGTIYRYWIARYIFSSNREHGHLKKPLEVRYCVNTFLPEYVLVFKTFSKFSFYIYFYTKGYSFSPKESDRFWKLKFVWFNILIGPSHGWQFYQILLSSVKLRKYSKRVWDFHYPGLSIYRAYRKDRNKEMFVKRQYYNNKVWLFASLL